MRSLATATALLAGAWLLAGCEFPAVPGMGPGIDPDESYTTTAQQGPARLVAEVGAARSSDPVLDPVGPEGHGAPAEIEGTLRANSVSSLVVESESGDREMRILQILPQSELRVGDVQAGLRELQPGSQVRARFAPTGDGEANVALEVVAEPASAGWDGARVAPPEPTEDPGLKNRD